MPGMCAMCEIRMGVYVCECDGWMCGECVVDVRPDLGQKVRGQCAECDEFVCGGCLYVCGTCVSEDNIILQYCARCNPDMKLVCFDHNWFLCGVDIKNRACGVCEDTSLCAYCEDGCDPTQKCEACEVMRVCAICDESVQVADHWVRPRCAECGRLTCAQCIRGISCEDDECVIYCAWCK
jgi:hypothetical protein